MSDKFNPLHYLDKRLLEETPFERVFYDVQTHMEKRKNEFEGFSFLVTNEYGILHNDVTAIMQIENNKTHYKIHPEYKKIFWLRINNSKNTSHDIIDLPFDSILVHEDISLNKSFKETSINFKGHCNYYYLNFHLHNQLFFNKSNFLVNDYLKSYFLTLPRNQKHKNQIEYELSNDSNLEQYSLSNIQNGQLHDDSINIIHSQNSHSKLLYQSLNKGKVSSQVNSLVSQGSIRCSTEQKIKHIVLSPFAITNSKPNLMIANNDIVASHGNSIGSFNKEDLFYLSQRGLTIEQSYSILASSIIREYLSKTSIDYQLEKYLEGFADHE